MSQFEASRRQFLRTAGLITGGAALLPGNSLDLLGRPNEPAEPRGQSSSPDYTLRIAASPIELAPKRIVSVITYNGQFPGPLLRFKEGQPVTIDIYNDTDTPEQLHWHGQQVPVDVDGAAEEGTPFIPPKGMRRITFNPIS